MNLLMLFMPTIGIPNPIDKPLAYEIEDLIFVNDPGPVEMAIKFNFLILYLHAILFTKLLIEQFLLPFVKLLFLNFKVTSLSIIPNIPIEE